MCNNGKLHQELQFAATMETDIKGNSAFCIVKDISNKKNMPMKNILACVTDWHICGESLPRVHCISQGRSTEYDGHLLHHQSTTFNWQIYHSINQFLYRAFQGQMISQSACFHYNILRLNTSLTTKIAAVKKIKAHPLKSQLFKTLYI